MVNQNLDKNETNNIHYGCIAPILPFIKFHELRHLVLGHLATPYDKKFEFEADSFTLIYIKRLIEESGPRIRFQVFLGLSSLYVLFYCKEEKFRRQIHIYILLHLRDFSRLLNN
jgi:hypothetical protein